MNLEESIKNFRAPVYVRTKRNQESYATTAAYVTGNLERLVNLYRFTKNNEQTARLIRDDIDNALRRYHEYCIKQRIGAHYVEIGLEGNGIFEHMIPASTVRDLLIAGVLTPVQACNVPTCRLSKERDDLLREKGWVSKTPDIYRFWKRYQYCFETEGMFTTWDGQPVDTNMTLEDHFKNIAISI
jgi:hypothetical protein